MPMSSDEIAIRVENLSKCFHIYDRPRDRLKQAILPRLRSLIGRGTACYFREFWALQGIDLEIHRGETVGIVGRNGSGKSTLLQTIYGTLEPTAGSVDIQGRVAALLELGAGFNPEFSGRENVYMNATVLGLEQQEIHDRFEDIAAFADIGDFIEQPVKHYSSGMYSRLAFAIAINVDPDILIVDEALAVGDETFQRKCFARMEEIKRNGGTILFVSHASTSIVNLCDRAILLHGGRNLYMGLPKSVIGWYQKLMNAPDYSDEICDEIASLGYSGDAEPNAVECETGSAQAPSDELQLESAVRDSLAARAGEAVAEVAGYDPDLVSESRMVYKPNGAEISNPRIESLDGRIVNLLRNGQRYRVCYEVRFRRDCDRVRFRCMLKTTMGLELGGGTYPELLQNGIAVILGQVARISLEFTSNLNPGTYFVNCGLSEHNHSLHRIIDAITFKVLLTDDSFSFGIVDFGYQSKIEFDDGSGDVDD